MTRPRILVTNDDGIHAEGLIALARALGEIGDVNVVAPDREQSGASHMLSLHRILRAKPTQPAWWAVDGSPTDCVYLAVHALLEHRPDIVVSGINRGPNIGTDVHYSGTAAAAIEGTLMGIKSIAMSCVSKREPNFEHAAEFARVLSEKVLQVGLPPGVTLNVNVPKGEPRVYQRTFLGHRPYEHSVERRKDPRGGDYFWIGGTPKRHQDPPGSDSAALGRGIISVTPVGLDLTDRSWLEPGAFKVESYVAEAPVAPPADFKLGTLY